LIVNFYFRKIYNPRQNNHELQIIKGKVPALVIAPRAQEDTATTEVLRYMERTKQCRTYLPYTFLAVAGTHLPTP